MDLVIQMLQVIVALGLLNVWVLRARRKTEYRGCNSCSLKEEFLAYGLPMWLFYLVGFLKVTSSIALLIGLWYPILVIPAAALIVVLMIGAVAMHIKVGDPLKKGGPAILMLLMSLGICVGQLMTKNGDLYLRYFGTITG